MVEILIDGHKTLWDLEDALKYVGQSLEVNTNGYLRHRAGHASSREYVHRELAGAGPDDYVDHINGDRLDNRRVNLRICTQSQNMMNQTGRSDNTSGVTGVHFCQTRRKWVAQIRVGGKTLLLGRFLDFPDAVAARQDGERKHYGAFSPGAGGAASLARQ